jgi:hypothetical protein
MAPLHPSPAAQADCPPVEASSAHGDVYRCCKSNPPAAADMETHEESARLPDADPCLRRAVSVFRDQQDAEHQVRLFRRWKRKFVARAQLLPTHGQVMLTKGQQPTHTSWWPAPGLDPAGRAALFLVVLEVQA